MENNQTYRSFRAGQQRYPPDRPRGHMSLMDSNFQLDKLSLVLMSLFQFRTHILDRKVPWVVKDQLHCKTGPLCSQCIRLLKLDLGFRQMFPQGTVQAQGH